MRSEVGPSASVRNIQAQPEERTGHGRSCAWRAKVHSGFAHKTTLHSAHSGGGSGGKFDHERISVRDVSKKAGNAAAEIEAGVSEAAAEGTG